MSSVNEIIYISSSFLVTFAHSKQKLFHKTKIFSHFKNGCWLFLTCHLLWAVSSIIRTSDLEGWATVMDAEQRLEKSGTFWWVVGCLSLMELYFHSHSTLQFCIWFCLIGETLLERSGPVWNCAPCYELHPVCSLTHNKQLQWRPWWCNNPENQWIDLGSIHSAVAFGMKPAASGNSPTPSLWMLLY